VIALASSERRSGALSCRFRRIDPPRLRVALEVTRRCNLPCPHCFVPRDGRNPALSELMALLAGLREAGAGKVILTGGEPLLRPDLETIVASCAEQSLAVDLNSNLVTLDASRARALRDAGLTEVSVSLYGGRRAHDRFVRHDGAWDSAVRGIGFCTELGLPVDVHCALLRQSVGELQELAELTARLGCVSLTLFTLLSARHGDAPPPDLDSIGRVSLDDLGRVAARSSIPVRAVGLTPFEERQCVMAEGIVGLTAGLEWTPCLLAKRATPRAASASETLEASLDRLRAEVGRGLWRPHCHPLHHPTEGSC
jgi:molybdenum cofactor biosynthesis enzyme MoaA